MNKFKIRFTQENTVKGIAEVSIGDVLDYVVKVGIKMNPEEIILSDKDSCSYSNSLPPIFTTAFTVYSAFNSSKYAMIQIWLSYIH